MLDVAMYVFPFDRKMRTTKNVSKSISEAVHAGTVICTLVLPV